MIICCTTFTIIVLYLPKVSKYRGSALSGSVRKETVFSHMGGNHTYIGFVFKTNTSSLANFGKSCDPDLT